MSAVSNRVTPASSAACTTLRVASRSRRMPKLLQPRPTAETRNPVVPNARCCMSAVHEAEHARRIAAENQDTILRGDCQSLDACHAVEIAHVEGVIAAEQHAFRADRADQEFERLLGMEDRIVEQSPDRLLRIVLEIDLRLWSDIMTVPEASGLVGQEAAAVREAHLEHRVAFEHAAEHQARAGDRGLERQADEVFEIIGP